MNQYRLSLGFPASWILLRFFQLIAILVFLSIVDSSCHQTAKEIINRAYITYTDGYGFSFDLPEECEVISKKELEDLRVIDPTITFIAVAGLPFGNTTFSVSVYDLHEVTPIDSAFIKTVRYVATTPNEAAAGNYRLIDYGIQNIEGKFLRYKISCTDSTIYNIMYYFMKDDYSNLLYELKSISPSEDNLTGVKDFLEYVALTAKFITN
jgi:hypothetical protein